jgi:hypothetical protein
MQITRRVLVLIGCYLITFGVGPTRTTLYAAAQFADGVNGQAQGPALSTTGRLHVQLSGTVLTGGIFANPANQTATISYFFTDANGVDGASGSVSIPPNGQFAKFFNELSPSAPTSGTLTYTSNVAISVIGFRSTANEVGQFLMTTVPGSTLSSPFGWAVTIPHWADGGGFAVRVVVINNTNRQVNGTAQFLNSSGAPTTLTINGNTAASFPYTIPPRSSVELVSAGTGASIQSGSVRLIPSGFQSSQSAFDLVSFKMGGTTQGEFSVPGSR